MNKDLQKIKEIVEKELNFHGDATHDMDHIMRVYSLALKIAETEKNVDLDILKAGVLLHDIASAKESADASGKTDHAVVGAEMAKSILADLGFSDDKIKHIQECILAHRYRSDYRPKTIEAKIVHDADKLESVGAIGVARSFAWISRHKAKIYKKVDNLEDYAKENLEGGKINGRIKDKSKHSVQINYETKDKFLVDNLYTKTAKDIGRKRLAYFKSFLERLESEVKGDL